MELEHMLAALVNAGGSDLHLAAGAQPSIRVHGGLRPLRGCDVLTADHLEQLLRKVVDPSRWERFEKEHELDFAYDLPGECRFRGNLYRDREGWAAAFRAVPHSVKTLEELGLPESVSMFAHMHRGLVLVTGPTGSGKTTTLAALLDLVNRSRSGHIITIEDPIEFVHHHQRCMVNQREVGADTGSFSVALRQALRQDPDVIMVGELRDLETMATALTAAETGHLVLATLHTASAAQTVDRVIDIFPAHQQQQVRTQLSMALQGVVSQALCERSDGLGRTVVTEIMFATHAIRNLIREGKSNQIPSFMQSGAGNGMLSFDQHLAERVRQQLISVEHARDLCHSPEDLSHLLSHLAGRL